MDIVLSCSYGFSSTAARKITPNDKGLGFLGFRV
jgi:hypothetical protein